MCARRARHKHSGDGVAGEADGGIVVAEGGDGREGGGVEGVVTKV